MRPSCVCGEITTGDSAVEEARARKPMSAHTSYLWRHDPGTEAGRAHGSMEANRHNVGERGERGASEGTPAARAFARLVPCHHPRQNFRVCTSFKYSFRLLVRSSWWTAGR